METDGDTTSHVQEEVKAEGSAKPFEGAIKTEPSEAVAQPSEPKTPDVGDSKTYTSAELKALETKIRAEESTRRSRLQSELDKQISERNKQLQGYQQQQALAEITRKEAKELEQYGDSPEVRQFHEQRRFVTQQLMMQQAAIPKQIDMAMRSGASDLAEKYTPDDATAAELKAFMKELYEAKPKSPEEMELLAMRKQLESLTRKAQVTVAKANKPPQDFHVPVNQGSGDSEEEFTKAYREGRSNDHARMKKILDNL